MDGAIVTFMIEPNTDIIILVEDRDGNVLEIDDMYWFEENYIHNSDDRGYEGYKIVGVRFMSKG